MNYFVKPGDLVTGKLGRNEIIRARNFPGPVGVGGFFDWGLSPRQCLFVICVLPTEDEKQWWAMTATLDGLFKLGWVSAHPDIMEVVK